MEKDQESERLESIAADSWYTRGFSAETVRYSASVFSRHWRLGACLELGPAEGVMTESLARTFTDLTLVEGSALFCQRLRARFPRASVHHALFEGFQPAQRFDTIILGHVLEHVAEPSGVLKLVRSWLAPGGRICAAVPNARSVHRQAAVLMGILPTEHTLNDSDVHHGHRRVYDPESFRAEFRAVGLSIDLYGGYWLKPLSNAQLDAHWTPEMLHAFMALGERYPDIAAEIYVVASG